MKKRLDEQLYFLGKIFFFPLLAFGEFFSFYAYDRFVAPRDLFACAFKKLTGLPCPGCGGTRAFVCFFRGDFLKSFCYNPIVIIAMFLYAIFMALFFKRKHISKDIDYRPVNSDIFLILIPVFLILQWIIKIILLFILK